MDNKRDIYNGQNDEISLKELILKLEEYIRYFWSKKWFIFISIIIITGGFVLNAKLTPGVYKGETRFFLEGNDNSGAGGLGGLLGQINIGGERTNPYKIIEVAESKLQFIEILFETIGEDSVFIANKILEVYDLPNEWGEQNPKYLNFKFNHDSIENFSRLENKVLLKVIGRVLDNSDKKALVITELEEDKGYYQIVVETLDHDLTMRLSEVCYEKLKYFFEGKSQEKLKNTRDLLKIKSDSIKYLVDSKVQELAKFKDRNRSLINESSQTKKYILETEIQGLTSAYLESVKSFEIANYKYLDRRDYFMLIDKPREPLGLKVPNWITEAIKGGLLSIVLSIGLLFMARLYQEIMSK